MSTSQTTSSTRVINAFHLASTARGYTLSFKENGKTRRIIFDEGTRGYKLLHKVAEQLMASEEANAAEFHNMVLATIAWLKKHKVLFHKNPNNPSVFYPSN